MLLVLASKSSVHPTLPASHHKLRFCPGVSFRAGLLSQQCPDGVAQVQQALVALVGRPKDEYEGQGAGPRGQGEEDGEDGMGPQMEHVMVHYYASRALRRYGGIGWASWGTSTRRKGSLVCRDGLWRMKENNPKEECLVGLHPHLSCLPLVHSCAQAGAVIR